MKTSVPIIFIGGAAEGKEFMRQLTAANIESFEVYIIPPVNAEENSKYSRLAKLFPQLCVGKGTAGCSLAHYEAMLTI